jgi:SAM-dependent methyltransferase
MSTLLPIPAANARDVTALLEPPNANGSASSPDSSQIEYYARSFGDPISRLFWHDGELHLGVLPPYSERFLSLLESDLYRGLVSDGLLIGLAATSIRPEVFDATFRLDHTPRITYWHEWSPAMLRRAALRMIDLCTRLARHGLGLRNPHPWNVLFDGRQFSYANAGSIVPLDTRTFSRSYEKIAQYFVRPLLLIEHGFEHIAQRLGADMREGVLADDVRHLGCSWCEWQPDRCPADELPFLEELGGRLRDLKTETAPQRWIDYFKTDCDFSPGSSWTRKQEVLLQMLEHPDVHSVLDLGANTGHYARLAAEHGREVIATDFDPALVDTIYTGALASELPVYTAVLDFVHPTHADGVDYGWFAPATERYAADLVLCFALAHHMVFGKYRLDFEQIARGVRSFTRGWALIEYVERGKIRPAEWRPDANRWYSVDAFAEVLRRHFPVVEILPAALDGRRLLVCGPHRRRA